MTLTSQQAQAFVSAELTAIYTRLAQGLDVSPAQSLHLEGQVVLLLQFRLLDFSWLQVCVNTLHEHWLQHSIEPAVWQWMADEQQFYLPLPMRHAPVYRKPDA